MKRLLHPVQTAQQSAAKAPALRPLSTTELRAVAGGGRPTAKPPGGGTPPQHN